VTKLDAVMLDPAFTRGVVGSILGQTKESLHTLCNMQTAHEIRATVGTNNRDHLFSPLDVIRLAATAVYSDTTDASPRERKAVYDRIDLDDVRAALDGPAPWFLVFRLDATGQPMLDTGSAFDPAKYVGGTFVNLTVVARWVAKRLQALTPADLMVTAVREATIRRANGTVPDLVPIVAMLATGERKSRRVRRQ
jgi:hypothetical protein